MKKCILVLVFVLTMLCGTIFASAAADPAVVLVNPVPNSTVYSDNLLISIKVTRPKTIKVKAYEEKQTVNGTLSAVNLNALSSSNGTINKASLTPVPRMSTATFECKNNLSFYTKQINGLNPGLYRIQIDTVDQAGKTIYSSNSYVAVREKVAQDAKIFETQQSGTMQFFQNLLKTIFGS